MRPQPDDDGRFDLDDLLWLIQEMPSSQSTPEELLADCGLRSIPVTDRRLARLIAQAQADGLVAIWEDDRPYVTLTPLAAERLGVQLSIDSSYWLAAGVRRQERVEIKPWEDHIEVDPERYVDPTLPEPIDVLIDAEARGELLGPGQFRLRDGSRLCVGLVLGIGAPWPRAILDAARGPCPGCGDARLARGVYCALCHAAGADGLLPRIEPDLEKDARRTSLVADLYVNLPRPKPEGTVKLRGGLGSRVKKKARGSAA